MINDDGGPRHQNCTPIGTVAASRAGPIGGRKRAEVENIGRMGLFYSLQLPLHLRMCSKKSTSKYYEVNA